MVFFSTAGCIDQVTLVPSMFSAPHTSLLNLVVKSTLHSYSTASQETAVHQAVSSNSDMISSNTLHRSPLQTRENDLQLTERVEELDGQIQTHT